MAVTRYNPHAGQWELVEPDWVLTFDVASATFRFAPPAYRPADHQGRDGGGAAAEGSRTPYALLQSGWDLPSPA
jgi:hypothetical protein